MKNPIIEVDFFVPKRMSLNGWFDVVMCIEGQYFFKKYDTKPTRQQLKDWAIERCSEMNIKATCKYQFHNA